MKTKKKLKNVCNKLKLSLTILGTVYVFLVSSRPTSAAWELMGGVSSDCKSKGNCTLDDFVRLFTHGYGMIFGIVGSLTLLMFVIGGVMFLTSGGSPERVAKGKKVITSSIIGLAIVFASYIIIQYVLQALGYTG
ncbi:MAG: pilin [Candidatus Pacebacteria bacterium]|nr:pilin [Candidatus Paceibacterota bacterium]